MYRYIFYKQDIINNGTPVSETAQCHFSLRVQAWSAWDTNSSPGPRRRQVDEEIFNAGIHGSLWFDGSLL